MNTFKRLLPTAMCLSAAAVLLAGAAVGANLFDTIYIRTALNLWNGASLTIQNGATIEAMPGARIIGFGGGDTAPAAAPRYAIFEIPLGIHGAQWTDFELKGSLNNFDGPAAQALCYFYGSAYGNGQSTHGPIGTTTDILYTDDLKDTDHGLARKLRRQDRTRSLFEQSTGRIGGVLVIVPVGDTIRPDNDNLAFVWQRVAPSQMEECWVPISPKWVRTYPHIP